MRFFPGAFRRGMRQDASGCVRMRCGASRRQTARRVLHLLRRPSARRAICPPQRGPLGIDIINHSLPQTQAMVPFLPRHMPEVAPDTTHPLSSLKHPPGEDGEPEAAHRQLALSPTLSTATLAGPSAAVAGATRAFPQAATMAAFPPSAHDALALDSLLTPDERALRDRVRAFAVRGRGRASLSSPLLTCFRSSSVLPDHNECVFDTGQNTQPHTTTNNGITITTTVKKTTTGARRRAGDHRLLGARRVPARSGAQARGARGRRRDDQGVRLPGESFACPCVGEEEGGGPCC